MTKIRIAGVPEHFMVPLHQGVANGTFSKAGLDVEMVTAHGGSGEMLNWLKSGQVELAVCLTEALVASTAKGDKHHRIVGSYVASPLHWAVSISPKKKEVYKKLQDLWPLTGEANIAISRFGSGSHVMAVVLQEQLKEKSERKDGKFGFEVGSNMQGMVDLVNADKARALMWEVFTTKPWYEKGELVYLDTISTPWQAFKIAASTSFLEQHPGTSAKVVDVITKLVNDFKANQNDSSINATMDKMGYSEQDVRKWFAGVRYAKDCKSISREDMNKCVKVLEHAGVISQSSLSWTPTNDSTALQASDSVDVNNLKIVDGEYTVI